MVAVLGQELFVNVALATPVIRTPLVATALTVVVSLMENADVYVAEDGERNNCRSITVLFREKSSRGFSPATFKTYTLCVAREL